jgi:alkanesulfonate monooxygenase SsuD/methylene tetrahydromethanopterin reductase-like flavin-dependent oxidoreductase (luciferase family)
MTARRQIHLAAHFPGVNNTTIWTDPASGSQIDFESFEHFARTAERGKFDFLFLAEGLRVREHAGAIHDLDVVGRPDTLTVLAAIAAITDRLGLVGTLNSTFNEPFELARQLASIDAVSGGRVGWNLVTSSDAFTGENFRRGGFLAPADRYNRAAEFVDVAKELWATNDAIDHHGEFFDVTGRLGVPASPQGRPIILQAGVSDEGRDLAARYADAIFSPFGELESGRTFFADIKRRLQTFGRDPDELKILPGASFVLGDTDAEADERYRYERRAQVSPATALRTIEAIWGRELTDFDPEGPLPPLDLVVEDVELAAGRASIHRDRRGTAAQWKERADREGLSIRDVVIGTSSRGVLVGTPEQVADRIDEFVQTEASDGFILVPSITPSGLDEFVDKVVPLLQERGSYRTDYSDETLRGSLFSAA